MIFHDYTVTATGELYSYRYQESNDLVDAAVTVFAEILESGQAWRAAVPSPGRARVELHWTAEGGAAVATFYADGALVTTSLLLASAESSEARTAFQSMIEGYCRAVALEPCREWQAVEGYPVIFSLPWPTEDRESMELVADMETCLAAAFFERTFSTR